MPDYFTHYIAAQIIYERLESSQKSLIQNKYCYLLGAQGGDLFFGYTLSTKQKNLGRRLHRMDAGELIKRFAQNNLSYAAGFATHYALDSELHPIVYAEQSKTRSPFAHIKIERDIGLYISRKYKIERRILPRERVLSQTGAIYDCIKRVDESITLSGVERALLRHFYYTQFTFKNKEGSYSILREPESFSDEIEGAISFGVQAVTETLCGAFSSPTFCKSFLGK